MSLKKTVYALSINENPIININIKINTTGINSIAKVILTFVIIIIKNTAHKENNKFTKQDILLEIGKIYLGIYTFFINDAPPITDVIDIEVASEKNVNNIFPLIK
jgi:hypothetical protein